MEKVLERLMQSGIDVYINEPLRCHTSFRIGGPAKYYVVPYTVEGLIETLNILKRIIPVKILGRGTNVLPSDESMELAVVSTEKLNKISIEGNFITCEGGVPLKKLCLVAKEASLSGLERAFGIPGSVGGAIFMNAGAFGWEIAETLVSVRIYDGNKFVDLKKEEMQFGYRTSIFKKRRDFLILSATFKLIEGDRRNIENEMVKIMKKRYEKQPLEIPSAGSIFKRPKPDFYVGSTLEKLGFKGFRVGDAKVSEKHAGFIVNCGNAKAEDVKKLINIIKERVKKEYNIVLETEVEIW
ncbi:UDP-N-acetylmuramate dehydrogenase [Thermosipho ferrireducens]|uniref:UDP-N-acetylenolpyruvoylglucosamine reductase n=1 Tax=Thermosipho ferrireducens TaxID=2571116 RepID=A0ABX7S866_9BACT|nr:UDP-N-acetylmuramate dehydrogenase [Thermosipho ferrireducens]QTA37817.1 UDP-N-acetylmuramate dehydrogenase [Thermosipho ferrireducens]